MIDHINLGRIVLSNGGICKPKERVEDLFVKIQNIFVGLEPVSNKEGSKEESYEKILDDELNLLNLLRPHLEEALEVFFVSAACTEIKEILDII